jgi:DNA helicase-2/ATP-dependent DNA helicase PcrA
MMDLNKLNGPQREAVVHTDGPLLVLAGAGSGKTRVLTTRIAYLIGEKNIAPYHILALTFTNKAAREMRDRIEKLVQTDASSIWIHTFHGFCARVLSMEIEVLGYSKRFVIYDEDDQQALIGRIIKDLNLNDKVFSKRMLAGLFSDAKNHSLHPAEYLRQGYQPQQVMEAFAQYEKRLKEANALDFDDLLLKTIQLFEQHPDVLQKYRGHFKYILVDEYQDTNMAQYHIVKLLAAEHRNLCVVGDDDQSIYGWRGADIRNILEFEKDFPGAHVVRLEQNYRSTAPILNAANRVIAHNAGRKRKTLWTDQSEGQPITVYEARGEREEAVYIAERILNGRRMGQRYDKYAILYRTHSQSRILEMILQSYAIPYKVYGGISFFSRSEVKDIIAYLRLICNGADDVAFTRVANVPRRNIGAASLEELRTEAVQRDLPLFSVVLDPQTLSLRTRAKFALFTDIIEEFYQLYGTIPLQQLTEQLLKRIGYEAYLKEDKKQNFESRLENIQELLGYIGEFEAQFDDPDGDVLQSFLNTVSLFMNADNVDEENGCVNLMTLHSAKGLEFDTVFLCGMEEGIFPSQQSRTDPDRLEEERRLCYVGITRAREKLYMTFADTRMVYGQFSNQLPSRFFEEMGDTITMPGKSNAAENLNRRGIASSSPRMESHIPPVKVEGTKPVAMKPKAAAKDMVWNDGDRVKHTIFGEGIITGVEGRGASQIVKVRFKNGSERRFSAAYTPLIKL